MAQGHIINVPGIGYVEVALLMKQRREALRRNERLEASNRILGAALRRAQDKHRDALRVIGSLQSELRAEKQVGVALDSEWTPSRPATPPQLRAALGAVVAEYWRAKVKHGDMTMDGPMTGTASDDMLRLACLMEEVGEVAHELTYDSQPEGVEGGAAGRLFKELIQVGNLALTWASALVPGPTIPARVDADHAVDENGNCAVCDR